MHSGTSLTLPPAPCPLPCLPHPALLQVEVWHLRRRPPRPLLPERSLLQWPWLRWAYTHTRLLLPMLSAVSAAAVCRQCQLLPAWLCHAAAAHEQPHAFGSCSTEQRPPAPPLHSSPASCPQATATALGKGSFAAAEAIASAFATGGAFAAAFAEALAVAASSKPGSLCAAVAQAKAIAVASGGAAVASAIASAFAFCP